MEWKIFDKEIKLIAGLTQLVVSPFPSSEVRTLFDKVKGRRRYPVSRLEAFKERRLMFKINLSLYQGGIYAYSERPGRLLIFTEADLMEIRSQVSLSFFEKYPKYLSLLEHINAKDTPSLNRDILLFEEIRLLLLSFIEKLLETKREGTSE